MSIQIVIGVIAVLILLLLLLSFHRTSSVRIAIANLQSSPMCTRYLSSRKLLPSATPLPSAIPVWMFWDGTTRPTLVDLCLINWRRWCHRSQYNFVPILVTGQNLHEFVDVTAHECLGDTDKHALKSDFIRLMLLHRYGGLYMDATIIVTSPLDWLIGKNQDGHMIFQAMYNRRNMSRSCRKPVVETSMLFSPPRHGIVAAWLGGLMRLRHCNAKHIRHLVHTLPIEKNLEYEYHLAYHVMAGIQDKVNLSSLGAFHLYDCHRERYLSYAHNNIDSLCKANGHVEHGRLLKLIASERKHIEGLIKQENVEEGSFLHRHLMLHTDESLPCSHKAYQCPFSSSSVVTHLDSNTLHNSD